MNKDSKESFRHIRQKIKVTQIKTKLNNTGLPPNNASLMSFKLDVIVVVEAPLFHHPQFFSYL